MLRRRKLLASVGLGGSVGLVGCLDDVELETDDLPDVDIEATDDTPEEVVVTDVDFVPPPQTVANVVVYNPLDDEKEVDVWVRLYDESGNEIATEVRDTSAPSDEAGGVPVTFDDLTSADAVRVDEVEAVVTDPGEEPEFEGSGQDV